jgi:hypothetical protein
LCSWLPHKSLLWLVITELAAGAQTQSPAKLGPRAVLVLVWHGTLRDSSRKFARPGEAVSFARYRYSNDAKPLPIDNASNSGLLT